MTNIENVVKQFIKNRDERIEKSSYLERKERGLVLTEDMATTIFETIEDKFYSQPLDFNVIESSNKYSIFFLKPNSGKTTMTSDLLVPCVAPILKEMDIFPVFNYIIPDSILLKSDVKILIDKMIDTIPYKLKFIPLYDKESVEGMTLDICRAKDCLVDKTGVVVLSSRSNINQGDKEKPTNEKEAKPYYKDLFAELRNRVDSKFKKVMLINILDEAGIAPETCGMSWHKAKKTLNIKDPSFMGAFNEYINSTFKNGYDIVFAMGMTGTPSPANLIGQPMVLREPVMNVCTGELQESIHYGGPPQVFVEKKPSVVVPLEEDALDDSYLKSIVIHEFQDAEKLVLKAYNEVKMLNDLNLFYANEHNETLEEYGIKVIEEKRMCLVKAGADDETRQEPKGYIKGETVLSWVEKEKLSGLFLMTKDTKEWNHEIIDGIKIEKDKRYIIDQIDNAKLPLVVVKMQLGIGHNNDFYRNAVMLTKCTDFSLEIPTVKTGATFIQFGTRSVRQCSGFSYIENGKTVRVTELLDLVKEMYKNGDYELAKSVIEILKANNAFSIYLTRGESKVYKQIEKYVEKNYVNQKVFMKKVQEYVCDGEETCICVNCPVHGLGKRDIDKDMSEISKKLEEEL